MLVRTLGGICASLDSDQARARIRWLESDSDRMEIRVGRDPFGGGGRFGSMGNMGVGDNGTEEGRSDGQWHEGVVRQRLPG